MPCAPGHARGVPLINDHSASRSRRWGALRSEIKEEAAGRGTFAEKGTPSAGAPPRRYPVFISHTPMRNMVRPHRHRNILRLAEHFITPRAAFAPGPGGLGATEGLAQVSYVLAVDEAHAGLHRGRHPVRTADVLGPYVAREAILDVVGQADRIGLVLERNQAGDRAEDFFLRNPHAVVDVGENRGHHI